MTTFSYGFAVADSAANALDDQTTALANDEIMRRVPQLVQLQAAPTPYPELAEWACIRLQLK